MLRMSQIWGFLTDEQRRTTFNISRFTRIAKRRETVGCCRALLLALQSRFAVHERRGRKLHRQQEENRQGHLISNCVHYCTLAQLSSRPLFTSYF